MTVRSYCPDRDFGYVCSDLDLGGMTMGQGYDTPFPWQLLCEILSRSNAAVLKEIWPGLIFVFCVNCDLCLGDMTLGQGHDTHLGHEQQLCEI